MDYRIEFEMEGDGRWIAEICELPGVLAYGVCMSIWPSSKAKKVLGALERIGWREDGRLTCGSHRQLVRKGYPRYTWAFHDGEDIGPKDARSHCQANRLAAIGPMRRIGP